METLSSAPQSKKSGFLAKLLNARKRLRHSPEGNPERTEGNAPSAYVSMELVAPPLPERIEKCYTFQTLPEPHYQDPREYPRLSPLMKEKMDMDKEKDKIDKESEEVEMLCSKRFMKPL